MRTVPWIPASRAALGIRGLGSVAHFRRLNIAADSNRLNGRLSARGQRDRRGQRMEVIRIVPQRALPELRSECSVVPIEFLL